MGFGFNAVTGDFSRGAAGFWIEDGELAYPGERGDHLAQRRLSSGNASTRSGATSTCAPSTASPTVAGREDDGRGGRLSRGVTPDELKALRKELALHGERARPSRSGSSRPPCSPGRRVSFSHEAVHRQDGGVPREGAGSRFRGRPRGATRSSSSATRSSGSSSGSSVQTHREAARDEVAKLAARATQYPS